MVELYLDSFICLHGMVLNYVVKNTGITLPLDVGVWTGFRWLGTRPSDGRL
jgi:hypothetical protein